MQPKYKHYLAGVFWGLVVLSVLYVTSDFVLEHITLARHQNALQPLQHPKGTDLLDSFSLPLVYYPATYVDESIKFGSGYVAGELRRFAGDWATLKTFYADQIMAGVSINVMPLEYDRTGGWTWFEIAPDFSYDPLEADILSALRKHYADNGWPAGLQEVEDNLYVIYGVWLPEK